MSLDQAFAHCPIFPTAASRRSMGRVSVPLWLVALSRQLPVIALVGHYPTNELMGVRPLLRRKNFPPERYRGLSSLSTGYTRPQGTFLTITHPSATGLNPFDLHVLGTPPALILSQDQTLQKDVTSCCDHTPDNPGEAQSSNQPRNQFRLVLTFKCWSLYECKFSTYWF